jgi:hypothetical protein
MMDFFINLEKSEKYNKKGVNNLCKKCMKNMIFEMYNW